jgi:L-threonylcarbamoyladenylate synthase
MAEVLPTHTSALFQAAVIRAAKLLSQGEPVALPTETVYGLAANAFDAAAVDRVFQIKGRPSRNPLIVHVASFEMARSCVASWPVLAASVARSFWPGPLTLVLPKSDRIPAIVTGGGLNVGIRWPSHPFTRAVIEACGFPLAAPSANLSNELSPTNAVHVLKSLGSAISLIVDGGQCQVGIESTVIDLGSDPPRVLRPGSIPAAALGAVNQNAGNRAQEDGPLACPGLLHKHYAPRAPLVLAKWGDAGELAAWVASRHPRAARVHIIAHEIIPWSEAFARVSVIPCDPEAYARAIYAELHECDENGADLIVVEPPPEGDDWAAVRDRLFRAASVTGSSPETNQ